MKRVICILLLFVLSSCEPVWAEWKVKAGYTDITCDYVQPGISIEAGYEVRWKMLGLEADIGFENHKINQVGLINTLKIAGIAKAYPLDWIWIGGGVGWLDNYCVENYAGETDIDDEMAWLAVLGCDIRDGWFVEVEGRIADIDIETGLPYETEIEKHSRADSVTFKIGYKY